MCNEIFCTDLDGTLIKGDITDGSKYFIGITEYLYSIGQVNSLKYPTYSDYAKEYFIRLDLYNTSAFTMPYEVYEKSQDPYIAEYWESTIKNFFVDYTFNYLKNKLDTYKQVWIVSASPLIYIKPIIKYLPVTKIVAVEPNKIITYGPGKVQRVQELTDMNLYGIGGYTADSWNNDSNLFTTLRNYNPLAELQWINHGQLKRTSDTYNNLRLYYINNIDAYQ